MHNFPSISDLHLFSVAARRASFIVTANELGKSPAWVSKRIAILESVLHVKLFLRTTRHIVITEEGESVYQWAQKILEAAHGLTEATGKRDVEPRGIVRITSNFRIGRTHVAPVLSELKKRYPGLEIWLEVVDHSVDLFREAIDIDVRIGNVTEPNVIAHRLVETNRILCASPAYLKRSGCPKSLQELSKHDCLVLKERDQAFGVWRLQGPNGLETVKVTGTMSTNNADIVHIWRHDGHGIILVSDRDATDSLESGKLVHILTDYYQPADIWAVCRTRSSQSPRVSVCLKFLQEHLTKGPYSLISSKRH